jgi:hypothetical protein
LGSGYGGVVGGEEIPSTPLGRVEGRELLAQLGLALLGRELRSRPGRRLLLLDEGSGPKRGDGRGLGEVAEVEAAKGVLSTAALRLLGLRGLEVQEVVLEHLLVDRVVWVGHAAEPGSVSENEKIGNGQRRGEKEKKGGRGTDKSKKGQGSR